MAGQGVEKCAVVLPGHGAPAAVPALFGHFEVVRVDFQVVALMGLFTDQHFFAILGLDVGQAEPAQHEPVGIRVPHLVVANGFFEPAAHDAGHEDDGQGLLADGDLVDQWIVIGGRLEPLDRLEQPLPVDVDAVDAFCGHFLYDFFLLGPSAALYQAPGLAHR